MRKMGSLPGGCVAPWGVQAEAPRMEQHLPGGPGALSCP